jgi:signal transduction histidine kinase
MPATLPPSDRADLKPSLRTELLFNLAFLAAGALVLAVISAVLAPFLGRSALGFVLLVGLIAADIAVFLAFGRYLVSRLVTDPMERLVEATQAVAEGQLERRAPPAGTRELDRLADSVNRMTERLLDAQSALIHAEKLASVGRLAAGVAHEVGNPLSAVANYVEVLKRRGGDPELVAAIEREAGRIDAIVRSLLDYARPRGAERERLDLGEVAQGAVSLLEAQGALRGARVVVQRDGGVPPVLGDRAALEQVMVNLLLNAVDAAGQDGRITVAVAPVRLGDRVERPRRASDPEGRHTPGERLERRSGRRLAGVPDGSPAAQIVVADSGPGVAPELEGRVFDPFFTTKPPGRGTGLGLAIVQRIVHDHAGRVDVGRAREGGAAFTVTLPAQAR